MRLACIINNQATVSILEITWNQALESLLPCSVPQLHSIAFAILYQILDQEVNPDGSLLFLYRYLIVTVEGVIDVAPDDRGLAGILVAQQYDLILCFRIILLGRILLGCSRTLHYYLMMITSVEIAEKPTRNYPAPVNATSHVAFVSFLTRDLEESLHQNRRKVAEVKAQLEQLQREIEHSHQQILFSFRTGLDPLWQTLQQGKILQKQENQYLQNEITDLRREKSILSQMISSSNRRLDTLKEKIGAY